MSALAVTQARAVASRPWQTYSPLLNKSYENTVLGRDVADWLAWLTLGGAADRTLDQYERDLSRLCLFYPERAIGEVTDGDLMHVLMSWPAGSRRTRGAAINSFFTWAVKSRRLVVNPTATLPSIKKPAQKFIDTFNEAETAALTSLPLVDGALMAVLLDAGLRKSEARCLQAKRCNLDRGELVVIQGKGGKDRVIPMTSRLKTTLADLFTLEAVGPQDYLWYDRPGGGRGRYWTPAGVLVQGRPRRVKPIAIGPFHAWWKRCIAEAGVNYRNPHTTRHTFATEWLRRDGKLGNLSRAMGHTSIKTTFDLYGHLDVSDVAKDVAAMDAGRA